MSFTTRLLNEIEPITGDSYEHDGIVVYRSHFLTYKRTKKKRPDKQKCQKALLA